MEGKAARGQQAREPLAPELGPEAVRESSSEERPPRGLRSKDLAISLPAGSCHLSPCWLMPAPSPRAELSQKAARGDNGGVDGGGQSLAGQSRDLGGRKQRGPHDCCRSPTWSLAPTGARGMCAGNK